MNPYLTATVVQTSKGAVSLVDAAYRRTSISEIVKTYMLTTGRTVEAFYSPASGAIPTGVWIFDKTIFGAVAFQGIEPANNKPYLTSLGPQEFVDENGGFVTSVLTATRLAPHSGLIARLFGCELQLLSGHSLGGLAAITIAALQTVLTPGQQRGVITFGSPRPFSGIGPTLKHCTNVIRWIQRGDAITVFPPRGIESLPTSIVLSGIIGGWPAEWYQPEGGRIFDARGGSRPGAGSGNLTGIGEADLLSWSASLPSSLSSTHSFPAYASSIFMLTEDLEGFWMRPLAKPDRESPSFSNPPIELRTAQMQAGFPSPMTMGCQSGPSATKARHVDLSQ